MIKKQFQITAITGFARPAALLASVASKFTSKICLEYHGKTVNLKNSAESLMDLMSLGIRPGTPFTIRAEGMDEQQAIQSIEDHLSKKKLTAE